MSFLISLVTIVVTALPVLILLPLMIGGAHAASVLQRSPSGWALLLAGCSVTGLLALGLWVVSHGSPWTPFAR